MEGKNVRTPEQQAQLEKDLFPIMEGLVRLIFPTGKISQAELKSDHGKILKVHVDELCSDEIVALSALVKGKDAVVCLKRSGTGITVVISFKAEKEVGEDIVAADPS
jgi:hypothetical protein